MPNRRAPEGFTLPLRATTMEPSNGDTLRNFLEQNERYHTASNYGFGPDTKTDPEGYNGYETWRDDVTMYLDSLTRKKPPEDAKFYFTVLVNWKPVKFKYTRWIGGRGERKETGKTTHLAFSPEHRLHQFDIEIPKEQFGEGRERIGVYMVSILFYIHSESEEKYGTLELRRFALYYNDTSWPEVPCREHYNKTSDWVEDEQRIFRNSKRGGHPMRIFPAQKRASYTPGDSIDVQPGQKIPINLFITHVGGDGRPGGALVPFFGSKMAHEMWMYKDGVPAQNAEGPIAYRRQFVVEAPKEAGTHHLYVGYWPDAYLPAKTFGGQDIAGRHIQTWPGDRSNIIPVHVSK